MSLDASLLATQLGQLGRDLDGATTVLAELEDRAVFLEGRHARLKELHEDAVARSFLNQMAGSVEVRKAQARLNCIQSRNEMLDALDEANTAKSMVRMQGKSIDAIKVRIDIGRSLLSREKSLMSLDQSGVSY